MSVQLVPSDRARLTELEAVVERGLRTFVEVGQALMEIRDCQLYRETHATFEVYCRERWQMTDRRGRQLMAAAEIGTTVPVANERQARELMPLIGQVEELCAAWTEAVENGKPTANVLREIVQRYRHAHDVQNAAAEEKLRLTRYGAGLLRPTLPAGFIAEIEEAVGKDAAEALIARELPTDEDIRLAARGWTYFKTGVDGWAA